MSPNMQMFWLSGLHQSFKRCHVGCSIMMSSSSDLYYSQLSELIFQASVYMYFLLLGWAVPLIRKKER